MDSIRIVLGGCSSFFAFFPGSSKVTDKYRTSLSFTDMTRVLGFFRTGGLVDHPGVHDHDGIVEITVSD